MRFTLKDYQADAVGDTLRELSSARDFYQSESKRVSSVALTAATGSGKTIMAAAVLEALFWGSDDFDVVPDPNAVALWFSDDPALNEQTRHRLQQASDRLNNRLVTVEHPFRHRKLRPGHIYFLNTSKLSRNSLLVRGVDDSDMLPGFGARPDSVPFTFWDTLRNTIEDENLMLYMVLDEAHRGLGRHVTSDKPTIVKRLINGHRDVPPMPVVWGISATVERFEKAMQEAEVKDDRVHLRTVSVDPVRIQESGLIKDDIVLDFPSESGDFSTVLLRRGVRKVRQLSETWKNYAQAQASEEVVKPLLVLQVPNKPSEADMVIAIDVIREEWPELGSDSIAHVFGEHRTQTFGPHTIPYISPERVQDASYIRVLLAKDAISTGWDCPRAEVMVSFRPAKDETHITQLLGRMIRTPLARRIEGHDVLNSVECILPRFDRVTASRVMERILGTEVNLESSTGQRVLVAPEVMVPNQMIPGEVWETFEALPTETLPRKHANPIRRLTALAHALATDRLLEGAGEAAHKHLHRVLDGLAARYVEELEKAESEVLTVSGIRLYGSTRHGERQNEAWTEIADDRAIHDAYVHGARQITPDIARTYIDHLVTGGDDEEAIRQAHVKVAAIARLMQTRDALELAADELSTEWLDRYRVAIKELPEARQNLYAEITSMSTDPQLLTVALPRYRQEETIRLIDGVEHKLEERPQHLLSSDQGTYPLGGMNSDEVEVLDTELQHRNTVAWYRNPTGGRDSVGIAYQDKNREWRTLRPDFLFFVDTREGVRANIVDPHGAWLPDSLAKLKGMARYASHYGQHYHRIESISRIEGELRVLDFTIPQVREKAFSAIDAEDLYRQMSAAY